jgi:cyclopropane fatty-acyl-phospholipid synthase-like methyltransferase
MHDLWAFTLEGKLCLAPIEDPRRVLDVGTGTGIWAIDFADIYPNTHITGADLSPIQPAHVPPNVQFNLVNCSDVLRVHEASEPRANGEGG